MDQRAYLVPYDFTNVTEAAASHSIQMARQTRGRVHLLHVVKSEAEKPAIMKKFDEVKAKLNLQPGDPQVDCHVKAGSIFTDIGEMAKKLECTLIVMGTHGAKGMQKVFGSFAIKVITSTDLPFVIVQDVVPSQKIKTIVFPINLAKETLQILNVAANMALEFDAEIHLLGQKESDPALSMKISINMAVVKNALAKKKVRHQLVTIEKSKVFHDKAIDYAKKVNADMIAISYFSDRLLSQFDPFAQSIITNKYKIPALILNSKETGNTYF